MKRTITVRGEDNEVKVKGVHFGKNGLFVKILYS